MRTFVIVEVAREDHSASNMRSSSLIGTYIRLVYAVTQFVAQLLIGLYNFVQCVVLFFGLTDFLRILQIIQPCIVDILSLNSPVCLLVTW